jgi:hypothetical protein
MAPLTTRTLLRLAVFLSFTIMAAGQDHAMAGATPKVRNKYSAMTWPGIFGIRGRCLVCIAR